MSRPGRDRKFDRPQLQPLSPDTCQMPGETFLPTSLDPPTHRPPNAGYQYPTMQSQPTPAKFDAALSGGSETPHSNASPTAQKACQTEPEFTSDRIATYMYQRPRPNPAETQPPWIPPRSNNTQGSPIPQSTPLPPESQEETADENKPLSGTGAGHFADAEIAHLRREHEKTFVMVIDGIELALQKRDEGIQMIKEESERSKKEIDDLRKEIHELRKQQEIMKADNDKAFRVERELKEERERMETEISQLKAEADARQKQAEHQLKSKSKVLEKRRRDEQDLKDAGYDPRDGQNSATKALSTAVRNIQGLRIIRLLLGKGADPISCIAQPGGVNRGAIHVAADAGYVDAMRIFIEHKVDLSAGDAESSPPLCYAKSEAMIHLLLVNGAKLDIANTYGDTALILAAGKGYTTAVHLLLAKGAKPDIQGKSSGTALIWAAFKGHEEAVRLLLTHGAKPDITNESGDTALILAVDRGHASAVRLLLASGANPDIQGNRGHTALILAAYNGCVEIVRLLLTYEVRLDITNEVGNTALTVAAEKGREEVVRLLLTNGAKPDIANNFGNVALRLAASRGHEGVARLLRMNGAK